MKIAAMILFSLGIIMLVVSFVYGKKKDIRKSMKEYRLIISGGPLKGRLENEDMLVKRKAAEIYHQPAKEKIIKSIDKEERKIFEEAEEYYSKEKNREKIEETKPLSDEFSCTVFLEEENTLENNQIENSKGETKEEKRTENLM